MTKLIEYDEVLCICYGYRYKGANDLNPEYNGVAGPNWFSIIPDFLTEGSPPRRASTSRAVNGTGLSHIARKRASMTGNSLERHQYLTGFNMTAAAISYTLGRRGEGFPDVPIDDSFINHYLEIIEEWRYTPAALWRALQENEQPFLSAVSSAYGEAMRTAAFYEGLCDAYGVLALAANNTTVITGYLN